MSLLYPLPRKPGEMCCESTQEENRNTRAGEGSQGLKNTAKCTPKMSSLPRSSWIVLPVWEPHSSGLTFYFPMMRVCPALLSTAPPPYPPNPYVLFQPQSPGPEL